MKRKIIKQGHNTLTITLPSDWARKFNLGAGSEIDIVERDNGLFVSTEKNHEHLKAEFNIDGLDIPTIWKYFMGVYREGYDEIKVTFSSGTEFENPYKFFTKYRLDLRYGKKTEKMSIMEFFHELTNRFIGYEIVEYGKDFVVIKEMSEITSKEFDSALRRIFLLTQQMAEENCEAMKNNNTEVLRHVHDVDINLDKFHDYCIRILNKTRNKDSKKSCLLFATLYLLELLGDEYKNIANHLIQDFSKADFKNIVEIAESIKSQFELYYSMFYKFEKQKLIESSELDKVRYFGAIKLYKKTKAGEEREIFHHLRIITRYLNALIELRVEMEFCK